MSKQADHVLRDERGLHFTKVADGFIDGGYMAVVGPSATSAYLLLCRRADASSESFPGMSDFEKCTGMTPPTIRAAIQRLVDVGLVGVERREGKSNVYTLKKIFPDAADDPAKNLGGTPQKNERGPLPKSFPEVDTPKYTSTTPHTPHGGIAGPDGRDLDDATAEQDADVMPKYSGGFESFWAAYPNKTGKDAAWRAWTKRKPSERLVATILAAIEAQRNGADWRRDGGRYIPHPATWINQGRWMDEVKPYRPEPPRRTASPRTADYIAQRDTAGF